MKTLLWNRNTAVWVLLVLATVVSWLMGHGIGIPDIRVAGVVIIIISLIKVRLVLFDFMELRGAPAGMRWAADFWMIGLGLVLSARFLVVGT